MILNEIIAATCNLVAQRRAFIPAEALRRRIAAQRPPLDMVRFLRQPGVSVIAEIKRASPSKGALNLGMDPAAQARLYAEAGADAISVLTEPTRFRGSPEDLMEARKALASGPLERPVLRKDFIVDSYQVLEARAWGADAVLLIVAALTDDSLASLSTQAMALGLTPLVEVHTEDELRRALACDAPLIGINNRNLRDFSISLETTRRLRPLIPGDRLVVSESGIREPAQMRELAALGVDAALIGEALVTSNDPAATLRVLKEAGR